MKINEIIKQKRKEIGLTQEELAGYLNISAPAVNKWEKGNSYPDITILPALARVLKVDLNELLSFEDELSNNEIVNFTNSLAQIIKDRGYNEGFNIAMDKIATYPNSLLLIASIAPFLDGALHLYCVENKEDYKPAIKKLYERMLKSDKNEIREVATTMLIARYMEDENYEDAKKLVDSLPNSTFDKLQHLAGINYKQGNLEEAIKLFQQKILIASSQIQTALLALMDIANTQNKHSLADDFSNAYFEFSSVFSPYEWTNLIATLELSLKRREEKKSVDTLKELLEKMNHVHKKHSFFMFDSIIKEETLKSTSAQFAFPIMNEIKTGSQYDFLKDNEEFKQLLLTLK